MTIQTIWATFFRYKNEINFEAENTLDQRYSRCKPQAHSYFPKSTFYKKKIKWWLDKWTTILSYNEHQRGPAVVFA